MGRMSILEIRPVPEWEISDVSGGTAEPVRINCQYNLKPRLWQVFNQDFGEFSTYILAK